MQKEQVEARQAQALQAGLDRSPQDAFDLVGRRLAEIALAGDPDAVGEPPGKRRPDDLFGLAVAVARREIEQIDPGGDSRVHGGDAFVERRRPPQHPEAAAAQGERRYRPQNSEWLRLHPTLGKVPSGPLMRQRHAERRVAAASTLPSAILRYIYPNILVGRNWVRLSYVIERGYSAATTSDVRRFRFLSIRHFAKDASP